MNDLDLENTLSLARKKAQIVNHFQYGPNLLQSSVQINEIFTMLDTILKEVIDKLDDIIPDINLAPYKEGAIDSTRPNLCWIELTDNYYGLILNMQRGIKYRKFSSEDIQRLLVTGQNSSWYLISKIQNLSYLVKPADDEDSIETTIEYFRTLIVDIIERFFEEHESSNIYHPAGKISLDKLENVFARVQIQNSNSITPSQSSDLQSSTGAKWSQSIIKTETHQICWQSAAGITLKEMTPRKVSDVINSEYLNERSDVEAFLENTFKNRKVNNISSKPNVFCYISHEKLPVSYVNLNYVVETQLHGYIEVEYTDGTEEKIYPDTSPILIQRGKNDITFMTVIKLDNNITKKIKRVKAKSNSGETILPNLHMTLNITGVIDE